MKMTRGRESRLGFCSMSSDKQKSYFIGMLLFTFYLLFPWPSSKPEHVPPANDEKITDKVLLFYVYANTHKHAYGNLKYFIDTAVRENDGVDYVFILQQVENKIIDESQLPKLPKGNGFYFQHENKCFDYGSIGWFIQTHTIGNPWRKTTSADTTGDRNRKFDLRQYKYFITMNASIRGPYFPPYFLQFQSDYEKDFNKKFYWYYVFTQRLNEKVKLVGCTLSCNEQFHIQSYFATTDWTGMSLLLKSGGIDGVPGAGVFGCYTSKSDTISVSELGLSTHILNGNYSITPTMSKYFQLTFSKQSQYRCTIATNPYSDKSVDGVSLEPLDVIFVKFNDIQGTLDAQNRAELYEKWTKNRTL